MVRIVPAALAVLLSLLGRPVAAAPEEEGQDPAVEVEKDGLAALALPPGLELQARLAARLTVRDEAERAPAEFRIPSARLGFVWSQGDLVKAKASLEGAALLDDEDRFSLLRDLYVRVQPWPFLGLRVGQFDKPVSRVALMDRARFPLISRGLVDDYVIEHLGYGDRDLGAMLEGRLIEAVGLDYAVGVFNGLGANAGELGAAGTKDVAGRLELKPVKWLGLGVSGSLKLLDERDLPAYVDRDDYATVDEAGFGSGYDDADFIAEHRELAGAAWLGGADLALRFGKLRFLVEGSLGDNWWFERYPHLGSAVVVLSYKARLAKGTAIWLEPAVQGEVLSLLTTWREWRARLWRLAPGLNLHLGGHVRLMVDGAFVFAEGEEADLDGSRRDGLWPNEWPGAWSSSQRLMVQLAFEL